MPFQEQGFVGQAAFVFAVEGMNREVVGLDHSLAPVLMQQQFFQLVLFLPSLFVPSLGLPAAPWLVVLLLLVFGAEGVLHSTPY